MNRRLAAAAVLTGALAGAPVAAADTAVVGATVFTGATGTASAHTVALSALGACPPYAGPGALTLYPGGSTDTLPSGSTWTLAEILQCGLSIPPTDLSAVEILRPDGSAEAPLSPSELIDPSGYADPAAPGALPVISNNGGQAQNTYTRPWRGGGDENARDQVTDSGPVQMLVYENTQPLAVRISTRTLRRAARSEQVALSATVRTAAGSSPPARSLRWRWTSSTGTRSTAPAPTLTIPQGTETVTVLVSDAANGSGGTTSIALRYKPVRSTKARTGGGGHATVHSTSGLGSRPPSHHPPAAHDGNRGASTPATSATTPATATPSTAGAPPAAPHTTTTSTSASTPHPHPGRHTTPHHVPARGGKLVRGRLLADVVPLSVARSALTHPLPGASSAAIASPAPAGRLTPPAAVLGGLVVLGLLALGGAREHRSRPPRLHR